MPAQTLVQIGLMAFVLLGPTVMVAVLISGLSRRSQPAPVAAERARPDLSLEGRGQPHQVVDVALPARAS